MAKLTISEKYLAAAKDSERRARESERQMSNPDLSPQEQKREADNAKANWQIARDYTETGMRLDFERGKKVAAGQKDAAAQTNALHGALREKRFARLAELLPKMSLQSAATHCEREGLGKAPAIVKQWNRHKKKGRTPGPLS